ncbi:hypothetical protein EDD17DRAFT_1756282 [Pisolithus thermaeus]|nr:hypothetical protein EV401DRAFT_2099278 [Pisolithus croceorrhizus]KAI6163328.1 hypothetical protein EDD17DRAFT_1756282 [Pisolithus thermaeus]
MHSTRTSLSQVRGPKSTSFLFGNLLELYRNVASEAEFRWENLDGNAVRVKGILGEVNLRFPIRKLVTETILCFAGFPEGARTSDSDFHDARKERQRVCRNLSSSGMASDIVISTGDVHEGQREILNLGFGAAESRACLATSQACAQSMVSKQMEFVNAGESDKVILNIPSWVSRATLDAKGRGAFDVQFGCLIIRRFQW